jgi:hypothetical protein
VRSTDTLLDLKLQVREGDARSHVSVWRLGSLLFFHLVFSWTVCGCLLPSALAPLLPAGHSLLLAGHSLLLAGHSLVPAGLLACLLGTLSFLSPAQIMNEFGGATPNEQLLFIDHRLLGDHTATLQHLRVPAEARLSLAISSTDEVCWCI